MPPFRVLALPLVLLLGGTSEAHSVPVTVPSGLNLGDQYRLAFVTSRARDAMSSDIADYNDFVTGVAHSVPELLALGTTWTAIGSTTTVDARDNTSTNPVSGPGVPIYNLAGLVVAGSNSDLWDGTIDNTISLTENGTVSAVAFAWTGTANDGTTNDPRGPGAFVLGCTAPCNTSTGYVFQPPFFSWVEGQLAGPFNQIPLYAISGVLTVIPEPGSGALLALGLVAFGMRRRPC